MSFAGAVVDDAVGAVADGLELEHAATTTAAVSTTAIGFNDTDYPPPAECRESVMAARRSPVIGYLVPDISIGSKVRRRNVRSAAAVGGPMSEPWA